MLIAIWFCVLFSSVAGASSVKKHGIIGQDAKLFNIDNDCAEPSLYNETEKVVASWNANAYTVAYMDPHYSGKIFMDKKRNIWIFDVERKDAGKYYLKCGIQSKGLEMTLTVNEELTEEQPQECPNNHPDFTKEDGWNSLFLGLQIVICIIVTIILLIQLANTIRIREGLINMKDWIQKKLCSQPMSENAPQNEENKSLKEVSGMSMTGPLVATILILVIMGLDIVLTNIFSETDIRDGWITGQHWIQEKPCKHSSQSHAYTSVMATIDGSELTEHQVRNWLEGHPEFFENNESLTESLVKSFLKLHPDFMKKNDEHEYYHQSKIPSLDELNITVKDTWSEENVNERQCVSTEMKVIASETGSSQNSGEHENHLQVTPSTIDELGITVHGTGREDNQKQWMSSQENIVTYETCSNSSSDAIESFRNTGYSGMQSIHKDEKKAAPKGDKAQTDSLDKSGKWMKKNPNSGDDNNEPHLGKAFNPK